MEIEIEIEMKIVLTQGREPKEGSSSPRVASPTKTVCSRHLRTIDKLIQR